MSAIESFARPFLFQQQATDKKRSEKISKQWNQYGWQHLSELQKDHPDFCAFLDRTKLIYKIRGYQSSLQNSDVPGIEKLKEAIHLDPDGHPCLVKQGEWTRWEMLKREIGYNPKTRELVSLDNSKVEWNYFYNPQTGEQGLNPQSRYNQIKPAFQLSQSEMAALGMDGSKCIFQVFTTSVFFISQLSHVGLRLIDQKGHVYSLGYETPSWEIKFNRQAPVGNYHAEISSLDYDEFTKFKQRRVTSLPMTPDQMELALERINGYTKQPLRFNRIRQNCATFVIDIMRAAKLNPPKISCKVRELFWDYISSIPYVGKFLDKIKQAVQAIFKFLSEIPVIGSLFDGLNYVAKKIATFVSNLLILSFGGARGSKVHPEAKEDMLDNRHRLTYFNRLIKSAKDLFKESTDLIYSPKRMIEWQLKQKNTFIHDYAGPRFYIVPRGCP